MTFWQRFRKEFWAQCYEFRVKLLAWGWVYAVVGLTFNYPIWTAMSIMFLVLGWLAHNKNLETHNEQSSPTGEAG